MLRADFTFPHGIAVNADVDLARCRVDLDR